MFYASMIYLDATDPAYIKIVPSFAEKKRVIVKRMWGVKIFEFM